MSVDYRMTIKRKKDDKVLGTCIVNQLKNIVSSSHYKLMHLSRYGDSKADKFEYDDIIAFINATKKDLQDAYAKVFEKKMLIALAKNAEIKSELEEDIHYIEDEEIENAFCDMQSASEIAGIVTCIVEDMERKDESAEFGYVMAYRYNAEGLPDSSYTDVNGNIQHMSASVFSHDVYCEVEALY